MIAMGAGAVALIALHDDSSALYRRFAYPLLALSLLFWFWFSSRESGVNRGGARRWITVSRFRISAFGAGETCFGLLPRALHGKKEQMIRSFSVGVLPHLMVVRSCLRACCFSSRILARP
jgi:cell division protein FtsW (lipid II flippase)